MPSPLKQEVINEIVRLKIIGLADKVIAQRCNVNVASVYLHSKKAGLTKKRATK